MVPSTPAPQALLVPSSTSSSGAQSTDDNTRVTGSTSAFKEPRKPECSKPMRLFSDARDSAFDSPNKQDKIGKNVEENELSKGSSPPEVMVEGVKVEPDPSAHEASHPNDTDASSATFQDREFDYLQVEPVRRSTSLKAYTSRSGSPARKKAVRFADAMGLDLESVKHVLNRDVPPEIPASAVRDLRIDVEEGRAAEGRRHLAANFPQPGAHPDFIKRVLAEYVCLENCVIDDEGLAVTGTVRVANIAFHKNVKIRYTINGWITSDDACASYVVNSNDGPTDRFSFTVSLPQYFDFGNKMEFAICYSAGDQEYWDSNRGKNYSIECLGKAGPFH